MTHILDPLGDGLSSLELVRSGGTDLDVVNAARVSYGKRTYELSERDERLIFYLLQNHHTSPFEHTQLVYRVKAPIYIVRQWMRHRIGISYNEISGRYAVLPLEFYTPKQWRIPDPSNHQGSMAHKGTVVSEREIDTKAEEAYRQAIETASKSYQELIDAGICRELARGVLPLCTYTQFIFTCNLVSLFHFVKLRADSHAQSEIQAYAKGLLNLARPAFPISIASWERLQGISYREEMEDLETSEQAEAPQEHSAV